MRNRFFSNGCGILAVVLIIGVAGCVRQAVQRSVTSAGDECETVAVEVARIKRELGETMTQVGPPSSLSSPQQARLGDAQQALRAAAAKEKLRQQLASKLQFLADFCQQ